jgi:L-lactate dehydrogenase complex protein LldF
MSAGATAFQNRARSAAADAHLGGAIMTATSRLAAGRAAALESLPAADALRDHARRIRAHTIAELDRYLAQFADEAERRGAHVHWAPTAADATSLITGIARSCQARIAVKSKSMVTEEIALNDALEAAGVRVVETDLGEFIVQLAGDRPSHIIAPVIHRTRADVAALFRAKLGARDEEVADIPALTALARRTLRREFLRADIGISGANFAVAETGSLCIVTNEGNGRLTTSVPRVHIAVVGIERVVPTVEDLGVLLQILARSATGQKLSVYTSIITGPRRATRAGPVEDEEAEADGPDEVHIVLVDNGRSRVLASQSAEILYCIRCGACLNACPVYRVIGGHAYGGVYPGPVGSVFEPARNRADGPSPLPHASSLCGACREVCPVRIDLPRLLLDLRAEPAAVRDAPLWLRLGMTAYAFAATRPWLFRLLARFARGLARRLSRDGWLSRLPGPLAAWTAHRDFPAPASRSFSELWRARSVR